MVAAGHNGGWAFGTGCAASDLRWDKTHLQQDGRLLVGSALKQAARVRHFAGGVLRQTGRYGMRLDVKPEPYDEADAG